MCSNTPVKTHVTHPLTTYATKLESSNKIQIETMDNAVVELHPAATAPCGIITAFFIAYIKICLIFPTMNIHVVNTVISRLRLTSPFRYIIARPHHQNSYNLLHFVALRYKTVYFAGLLPIFDCV